MADHYERRTFIGLVAVGGGVWSVLAWRARGTESESLIPKMISIAEFDDSGECRRIAVLPEVRKTLREWREVLPVDQFMMTRRADTEFAYTGEYWNFHGDGIYRCVCCGTALFDSRAKFDSGTGWPSFAAPIAKENVRERADESFGLRRREVLCARCDAHHGHVFEDGPEPRGLRYCVNSAGLRFALRDFT